MAAEIADALQSLEPTSEFMIREDVIEWLSPGITQPTDVEIQAEIVVLDAAYASQAYARSRKEKYDLLNQDEMRYDDLVNSTTTWQDAIAAIKTEFPKE
jgi:hypothetical protein